MTAVNLDSPRRISSVLPLNQDRFKVPALDGQPFALLGVNSDEDREALRTTLKEEEITWRSWWDEGQIDGPIQTKWQIVARPSIHILDHKGVIRHKNIDPEDVDAAIDELLAEVK